MQEDLVTLWTISRDIARNCGCSTSPGISHHPDVPETASVCQLALKELSVQDVDIDEDVLTRYVTAVFPNAQLT